MVGGTIRLRLLLFGFWMNIIRLLQIKSRRETDAVSEKEQSGCSKTSKNIGDIRRGGQ